MGEELIWNKFTKAAALICAIYISSSACSSHTPSSMQESLSSGTESQQQLAPLSAPDEPPERTHVTFKVGKMTIRGDWSMKGWTVGPVTLMQAFGIRKGNVQYPSFVPQMSTQVATSQQNSGKGATGGSPAPSSGSEAQNAKLGQQMVEAAGWGSQWPAFNNIVMAESGWNVSATNPSSGAYGIPQALPGSKMASAGANWQTSAATQIAWMIGYIRSRYGNPNNAWAFHLANGWY